MNYFILGQIGIAVAVIFSMAIVQIQSQQPIRPPWYYFISVWSVSVTAAFMFSSGYTHPGQDQLPHSIYIFRFVLGIERTLAWYWLKYRSTRTPSVAVIGQTNHVLSVLLVLVMLTTLGYGTIYTKLQANSAAIQKLGRAAAIPADTTRLAALQRDNDSQRADVKRLQAASIVREKQIAALQAQVAELIGLIIDLKGIMKNVGNNVERTRRSTITLPPINTKPTPVYVLPVPRNKYGDEPITRSPADSTQYAKNHNR